MVYNITMGIHPAVGSLWFTLTGVRYMLGEARSFNDIHVLPPGVVFTIVDYFTDNQPPRKFVYAKFLSSTGESGLIDMSWWSTRDYLEELDSSLGTTEISAGVFTP